MIGAADHRAPAILDTTGTFESYARKAFLEGPAVRERLWVTDYEVPLTDVLEAFYACSADRKGRSAVVRELSEVRSRVRTAGPAVRQAIEDVEPVVRALLDVPDEPAPVHVLMVGPYSTNAVVGAMGDDVAVFHCLEWFHPEQATPVLVAHEDTHAWHRLVLGAPPDEDAAWLAFSEGVATQVSRRAVPDRAPDDYYWYGHAGFEEWLPWCTEHRDELLARFASEIDDPAAADTWFGSGLVDGRWRVGYYVADQLMATVSGSLPDLVRLDAAAARDVVRVALSAA